jgi:hypothetical protein
MPSVFYWALGTVILCISISLQFKFKNESKDAEIEYSKLDCQKRETSWLVFIDEILAGVAYLILTIIAFSLKINTCDYSLLGL